MHHMAEYCSVISRLLVHFLFPCKFRVVSNAAIPHVKKKKKKEVRRQRGCVAVEGKVAQRAKGREKLKGKGGQGASLREIMRDRSGRRC